MSALPSLLETVRRDAVEALQSSLNAMCDGADDALFDMSQKAPADEQGLYYDAMRELRLRRQALVSGFVEAVGADFDSVAGVARRAKAEPAAAFSLDSLTLVGEDELDVSVALQAMVVRARDAMLADLEHLRLRFAKVLTREVAAEQLPLHPERICEHFRAGIDALKVPVKARLILFKLFERKVLDELHDVVAAANQSLVSSGVLPDIKSSRPRPRQVAVREGGGGAPASHVDEATATAVLGELLALARGALGGGFGGGGMLPGGGAPLPLAQLQVGQLPVIVNGQAMVDGRLVQSDVPLVAVPRVELTALLTRLQQMQPVAGPGRVIEHGDVIEDAEVIEASRIDVKGELSGLIREEDAPRALNSADDDVINLVSMLFDFILDDAELPSEMKALIGRLQIPLLKVALLDKAFFADEEHPARRLVNALARAGIGWSRESDDGLYARMEQVVYAILNDFADDLSLFSRLGDDFADFVAERERRMSMIEARLRDREEGHARTEEAQRLVRDAVASRIGGRTLPAEVVNVIQEAWQRVLQLTAVRDGADSEAWLQRLKVLEVMVWCAQRYERPDLRERQRGLVPRLLVSLRKGFEATGFDAARGEALLAALNTQLLSLAGGAATRTVRVVAEAPKEAAPVAGEAVQVLRRSDDEVVIAASAPPPPPAAPTDEHWLNLADGLTPGSWVEYHEEDFKVRGKIAAKIKAQGKYVFVNGRGVKIFEKTVPQLAVDLQGGSARLVSDTALFDRALETMISRLRTGTAAGG